MNRNGELLRAFATDGEGPGEFNLPFWMGFSEHLGLIVLNGIPPSISVLNPVDGKLIEKHRAPLRVPMNVAFDSDSAAFYLLSFMFGQHARLDRLEFSTYDTVPILSEGPDFPTLIPGTEETPRETRERVPIAASPRGGVFVGHSWNYRVREYDANGKLVNEFGRTLGRPRDAPVEGMRLKSTAHFDDFGLNWDPEAGRLWVRTYRGSLYEETIFDVFDGAGKFIGSVTVPVTTTRDFQGFDVEGNMLVTWNEDESGMGQVRFWMLQEQF